MNSFSARATKAVAQLKADIEGLATEVRHSTARLNDFGGEHFVILNGALNAEGAFPAPWPCLGAACARSLAIASTLSAHHRGDTVTLFWRVEPDWDIGPEWEIGKEDPSLYMRLSFAINGR